MEQEEKITKMSSMGKLKGRRDTNTAINWIFVPYNVGVP